MGRNRLTPILALTMVALFFIALTASGPVIAGDAEAEEVKKVKKIKIQKKIDCEGEECEHVDHHRMIMKKHGDIDQIHVECEGEECEEKMQIFISEGGVMHKVHAKAGHPGERSEEECEGEDCDVQVKVFVTKDGEIKELHGAAAHHMMLHGEECEGEDCKQQRRIIIKKGNGMHQIHQSGDFSWFGDASGEHFELIGGGKGGFLGIHLTDLTDELRTHFGAPANQGVMVGKVQAESAAETAGLQVGDIVTSVNGKPVGSSGELAHAISSHEGGESVELGILRNGHAESLTAVLGESRSGMHHGMHTMVAFCGEDEDCEIEIGHHGAEYDCRGAEECKVQIECKNDECTCTANGESIDCDELDLPHLGAEE